MFATAAQSTFNRIGGQFSQAFLNQPFRKESGDNSVVLSSSGNLYRLEGILGMGGLSVVYRATRFSDGEAVALKIANLRKAPEAGALLQREAELLGQLNHRHIVKMFDHGFTADGDPFIAMELLKGQTLEQLLVTKSNLDLARVSKICLQVAEAVQYVHEQGILHRDIKPGNIMLIEENGEEKAVIYDFGISLTVGEDGTSYDETSSGSLLYASPEQLSEEGCSYYTDVYQLALVMFEALTGRLPFEISVAGALNYRRGQGPLLLSDEELGEQKLHTEVRNLLEEALERDPQRRTRDMRSFIQKLQDAVCQPLNWSLCANAV